MKKICLIMILIFSMSILFYTVSAETGGCGSNARWTYENGVLTISGNGKMYNYSGMTPWYSYKSKIKSVIINDGITAIGTEAFAGLYIKGVYIPESVTRIEAGAFNNCMYFVSVVGGKSLSYIGKNAFGNTQWHSNLSNGMTILGNVLYKFKGTIASGTTLTLPSNIESIAYQAFYDCSTLESIQMSEKLKTIEQSAFYNCTMLKQIILPKTITSVGNQAFYNCTRLKKIYMLNKDCSISSNSPIPTNTVIYGFADSTAKIFATENSNAFYTLKDDNMPLEISSVTEENTEEGTAFEITVNPHDVYSNEKNLIIALYDVNNRYIDCIKTQLTVENETVELSTKIKFENYKIFIWSGLEDLVPLAYSYKEI